MRYKIISPIVTNGEIIGYILTDGSEIKKVKLSTVIDLALARKLDAKAVKDANGTYHIMPNEVIEIEDNESYSIEYRIIQGGKLVAYHCRDLNTGKIKKVNPFSAWELAVQGKVTNAEGKLINDKPAIFGKGIKLYELPILNIGN